MNQTNLYELKPQKSHVIKIIISTYYYVKMQIKTHHCVYFVIDNNYP